MLGKVHYTHKLHISGGASADTTRLYITSAEAEAIEIMVNILGHKPGKTAGRGVIWDIVDELVDFRLEMHKMQSDNVCYHADCTDKHILEYLFQWRQT